MTLIIGFRSKNGVAIGSDRKLLRGMEVEYSPKYFIFEPVVFVAEGLTGIVDDFYYILRSELGRRRGVDTLYELKIIAEDIIMELSERYGERVGQRAPVGVLLAGLENITYGEARLYYIHGEGYGEHVDFVCTGHGGPYALSLAKFLLDNNVDIEENAKRIAYTLLWVAEEVDTAVGGLPDVLIIKDRKEPVKDIREIVEKLDEDPIRKIMKKIKEDKRKLPQILGFSSGGERG